MGLCLTACKKQTTETAAPPPTPSTPVAAPGKATFAPAHKTTFTEVTSQLDPGGSLYLYLATDQCLAGLSTNVSRLRDLVKNLPDLPANDRNQVDRVFDLLTSGIRGSGIENLAGVGVSSAQIAPDLYRSKLVLHHPQGQGQGLLWDLLGRQAHALRALDMLPNTTALAAFGDLDLTRAWNSLERALLDSDIPDLAQGLRVFLQEFEHGTKLSWTNVLASLGGEAGLIVTLDESRRVTFPLGPNGIELPEPGLLVALKTRNDTLYNRVSQELKSNPQTAVTEEPGLKMSAMPLNLPLPLQLEVTVASSGDYFFAATSPDLVRTVLRARKGGTGGLATSAEFKALLRHLPADGNQFFYASKRFSETILELRKQALRASSTAPAQLAVLEQFLGKNASFGLAVGGCTRTGWQLVSVGNQDSSGAVLLAPVIGAVAVPAAMLLPALANAKARAQSINCVNNLKQIGLAFRIWAVDHDDRFPFNVSTTNGGTLELCAPGESGFDENAFRHFLVMSNELATPKILVCPADSHTHPAANFSQLRAANVTYQVRSGPDINETHPDAVLVHCPIHGHDALCDGSVRQAKPK